MAKTTFTLMNIKNKEIESGFYEACNVVTYKVAYTNSMTGERESYEVHAHVYYSHCQMWDGQDWKNCVTPRDVAFAFEDKVEGKGKFYFEKNEYARKQLETKMWSRLMKWLKKADLYDLHKGEVA